MSRHLLRRLAVVPALMVAATGFSAEQVLPPQDRGQAFRMVDKDNDGWITREEASADRTIEANFDQVDHDKDNRLSLPEFEIVPLNRSDQPGQFQNPERG